MLEVFDRNPASRVFHVDEECYVLYLGAHWDDYKPFLRLGTSTNLPPKLPPIVSTIVVPDVLTGNPLDEKASLGEGATSDTHYVGDVRTVNKLESFVGVDSIPVEGLKRASKETNDDEHVYVYSYKDGNLKIKYHKSEIFDLRRRERQDMHHAARAQSIKNEFGRGPFRYLVEAYQRPGFVIAAGEAYVISHGEIAAPGLRDNYFAELASCGVDPDRVATVRVDNVSNALVRYYKRCRIKERVPRIATNDKDTAKALAAVFRANSLPALKVSLADSESFEFHKIQISAHSGWSRVSFPDLDGPVVFGSAPSKMASAMMVNHDAGSIEVASRTLPLIEGCVYQFDHSQLTHTEIRDRYLPEKNYPYRDMLGSDENNLIDQLAYYFSEMFAGRDPAKVMKSIKGNSILRDSTSVNPVARLVVSNARELAGFISATEENLARPADQLATVLERVDLGAADIPAFLPVIAEIRSHNDTTFLFYRFGARITGDRVGHAERVVEKIVSLPHFDFESERMRLAELIEGLADPEQMEEARLKKIAERKKPAPKPAAPVTTGDTKDEGEADERKTSASGRGSRRRALQRGPRRWLIPLIVVLLLLGLGAVLFTDFIFDSLIDWGTRQTNEEPADSDPSRTDPPEPVGGPGPGRGNGPGPDEPVVPPQWESCEAALKELEQINEITITRDGVIGPGGVEITMLDIIFLVNRIAVDNGFKPMDSIDPDRPDPDWIYPDNVFVLPDATRYTVVEGDTLWGITVRYMVARLVKDMRSFEALTAEYERDGTGADRRGEIRAELDSIGDASHSENFTLLVGKKLSEWAE